MHYLENVGRNYELGIKAIYEFEQYIQENFNDVIKNCYLCKILVFNVSWNKIILSLVIFDK